MKIADKSIDDFLNDIATKPCTPAGGCVAGLSAASAAALMEMVARHTLNNKKKSKDVIDYMDKIVEISSEYRKSFLNYMDIDTEAYNNVIKAQKNKEKNLEEYHKSSINIPLEMAQKLINILDIIKKTTMEGSQVLVTDGVAALLMAKTALTSLIYHIKFNLMYIKDKDFTEKISTEIQFIEERLNQL